MKLPGKIPVLVCKEVNGKHIQSIEHIGKDDPRYEEAKKEFLLWNQDTGREDTDDP